MLDLKAEMTGHPRNDIIGLPIEVKHRSVQEQNTDFNEHMSSLYNYWTKQNFILTKQNRDTDAALGAWSCITTLIRVFKNPIPTSWQIPAQRWHETIRSIKHY
ncbi:hypothetical protein [Salmonella enterica]|uniref:hypothetical protein n=1 Tax=Salmonella enterica TaxID=28901 RepID=UPI0011BE9429|nr:hypothetical protein [Salmonella enterica]TXC14842.1 hypothetical protein DP148_26760 [Salmonella enterica subsp. enterica serovar Typhimurium]